MRPWLLVRSGPGRPWHVVADGEERLGEYTLWSPLCGRGGPWPIETWSLGQRENFAYTGGIEQPDGPVCHYCINRVSGRNGTLFLAETALRMMDEKARG